MSAQKIRVVGRGWALWSLWLMLTVATGMAHAANTVTYVYTDPQGTPLAEADVNGNITATYNYTPYGSMAPNMSAPPNGPGYTGHVNDPDTGFVYMQARYYDPAMGRFLSTDPVGPAAGNTFNFSRYAYANNNPIGNTDPTGMAPGDANDNYRSAFPYTDARFDGNGGGGGGGDSKKQHSAPSAAPSGAKQVMIGLAKPVMNLLDDIAAVMGDSEASKAPALTPSNPSQAVGMMVGSVIVGAAEAAATDGDSTEFSTEKTAAGLRNGHLANGAHPKTGIPFTGDGFPDFSGVSIIDVSIQQTGSRAGDFRAANRAAGLDGTPEGYTWHHHQDGTTMQLVPRDVHAQTGHTGGFNSGQ